MTSPVDYRWNLIPDGNGQMILVDINPIQAEVEPFFNAETDTIFLLFTRINPSFGQRITWNANSISGSSFNPNNPVRMIIHGFNGGPSSSVNVAMTAAYLQRGDFNVIV